MEEPGARRLDYGDEIPSIWPCDEEQLALTALRIRGTDFGLTTMVGRPTLETRRAEAAALAA